MLPYIDFNGICIQRIENVVEEFIAGLISASDAQDKIEAIYVESHRNGSVSPAYYKAVDG